MYHTTYIPYAVALDSAIMPEQTKYRQVGFLAAAALIVHALVFFVRPACKTITKTVCLQKNNRLAIYSQQVSLYVDSSVHVHKFVT